MTNKKVPGIAIFVVIVALLFIFILLALPKNYNSQNSISQPANFYTEKAFINNKEVKIEIADTNETRIQGLSGRKSMPQDAGMLFVFENKDYYSFWMPDTYFPLDLIWISGDTIVDITENVPNYPGPGNESLPRYRPTQPADKILELNAGSAKSMNINIGDKIRYE